MVALATSDRLSRIKKEKSLIVQWGFRVYYFDGENLGLPNIRLIAYKDILQLGFLRLKC
jgi:hypothetical protein